MGFNSGFKGLICALVVPTDVLHSEHFCTLQGRQQASCKP